MKSYDVAVIGGGFYGSFLAYRLAQLHPELTFVLLEKGKLFGQAAASNQGQLHRGYLYAGNPKLAEDCIANMALFEQHFGPAINSADRVFYGVHKDSKVDAANYEKFCAQVGLELDRDSRRPRGLFGPDITRAYLTPEKTFDSVKLADLLLAELIKARVEILEDHEVTAVEQLDDGSFELSIEDEEPARAKLVFNTAFVGINELHANSGIAKIPLKYDTLLHFLVELPDEYKNYGASVVAGPFSAVSPSSVRGGHIFASARYRNIASSTMTPPSEAITQKRVEVLFRLAVASGMASIPILEHARLVGHTVGTTIKYSDVTTGNYEPSVVTKLNFDNLDNYHVVIAGKVGCVFDVLEPAKLAITDFLKAE